MFNRHGIEMPKSRYGSCDPVCSEHKDPCSQKSNKLSGLKGSTKKPFSMSHQD